ncbi:SDR family oxidoreductase [Uruburuella suis]|uniref:SDR family oxidoreductase n=1 Tax=Uruburuella suis TaxID=252130 RepID=UPI002491EC8A|nr:SDR family oxidoreductase [Uruburuella suis]
MSISSCKTAIVTGASRGLGRQIALYLATQNINIVVNYAASRAEADAVAAEINAAGGRALAVQADVGNEADVARLFEQALAHFGRIDIVVNNAGTMITRSLKDSSTADFERQFDVNVKSVFLMLRQAAAHLADNGRIINISSSASRLMMPGYAVYSAAKAAVEQMSRVFAQEVGARGITVNCVLPGPLNTTLFTEGKSPEIIQNIAAASAFNRIGEVADIVPLVAFLASDDAQWITGQSLGANGGMA